MDHPFKALEPEYLDLMRRMVVKKTADVDAAARRLLSFYAHGNYTEVSEETGVPIIFMATSFEREASSNFLRSPAQGDRWDRVSVNVPRGLGPYPSWKAAAIAAYAIDGLDRLGKANWNWAYLCYYGEAFNGFGYRDYHHEHIPYDWAGTNIQESGKYVSDGKFSATAWDTQLGIVPMARRMVELAPELEIPGWPGQVLSAEPVARPIPAPLGVGGVVAGSRDMSWVQRSLNVLEDGPIAEDGDYGRATARAVRKFQTSAKIDVDGIPGPATISALEDALRRSAHP